MPKCTMQATRITIGKTLFEGTANQRLSPVGNIQYLNWNLSGNFTVNRFPDNLLTIGLSLEAK